MFSGPARTAASSAGRNSGRSAANNASSSAAPKGAFAKQAPPGAFVCRLGALLPKAAVDVVALRAALTVVREVDAAMAPGAEEEPIEVFRETRNNLVVPKFFARELFGPLPEDYGRTRRARLQFAGRLRDYQEDLMAAALPAVRGHGGGLLNMPCGAGKTTVALYIAAQLGVKTLIVVHKKFLMDQWLERIGQFLPGARVGALMGKTVDVAGKDIVIGMLQSLSMKEYDPALFDHGLTIIDECHHISSRVFSQALFKVNSRYMIGLSATPDRKDRLERVFHWFVGPTIYKFAKRNVGFTHVHEHFFASKDPLFRSVFRRGSKNYNTSLMLTNLTQIAARNELIVRVLVGLERGRRILVLSDRLEHLRALAALLEERLGPDQCGFYVGGMKAAQLKAAEDRHVILATYHYACEGLDIKGLDTVLLATPRTTIEQSIGRILRNERLEDYRFRPLIVDIVDNLAPFSAYFFARNRIYLAKQFTVRKFAADAALPQDAPLQHLPADFPQDLQDSPQDQPQDPPAANPLLGYRPRKSPP